MRMLIAAAAFASCTCLPALAQSAVDPALRPVLERMAAYVARCGEQASAIVAVWVIPENGTVVRTRLKLRKFLDTITSNTALGPASRRSTLDLREIDSEADIDVTYRLHKAFGIWLPAKMSEFYTGPLVVAPGTAPVRARASTIASYSDFKQFTTAITIK